MFGCFIRFFNYITERSKLLRSFKGFDRAKAGSSDREWSGNYNRLSFGFTDKETDKNPVNQRFHHLNVYVYSDASFLPKSGTTGIGNYYGDHHPLNLSLPIGTTESSFAGELRAIIVALHRLYYWSKYKGEKVVVRTDALYVIYALWNLYCEKEIQRGLAKEAEHKKHTLTVDDKKNLKNLLKLMQMFPMGVCIQWVPSHDSDPANERADQMARVAIDLQKKDDVKERKTKKKFDKTYHQMTVDSKRTVWAKESKDRTKISFANYDHILTIVNKADVNANTKEAETKAAKKRK